MFRSTNATSSRCSVHTFLLSIACSAENFIRTGAAIVGAGIRSHIALQAEDFGQVSGQVVSFTHTLAICRYRYIDVDLDIGESTSKSRPKGALVHRVVAVAVDVLPDVEIGIEIDVDADADVDVYVDVDADFDIYRDRRTDSTRTHKYTCSLLSI